MCSPSEPVMSVSLEVLKPSRSELVDDGLITCKRGLFSHTARPSALACEVPRSVVYHLMSMMLTLLKVSFVWFLLLCDLRHVATDGKLPGKAELREEAVPPERRFRSRARSTSRTLALIHRTQRKKTAVTATNVLFCMQRKATSQVRNPRRMERQEKAPIPWCGTFKSWDVCLAVLFLCQRVK